MNHPAEQALKQWLETEGVAIPIHTGLSAEVVKGDEQVIVVSVADSEHVVGPLNRMNAEITVSTPTHVHHGDDFNQGLLRHREVFAEIRELMEDYDNNSLENVYLNVTGDRFAGAFINGQRAVPTEGRWESTIDVLFGSQRPS